jgi:putative ATP-dependent endonuclease of the OLD family
MRIDKIQIRSYRSCKDVTLFPGDVMALVGPNNSGKSNILAAINFVLGERWPTRQGMASSDYYRQDERRAPAIEICFAQNTDKIAAVSFGQDESNAEFKARCRFHNNSTSYYLKTEWREKCAVVYLDAARNFDTHFSASRWSLFGRIARELHDDFMENAPPEVATSSDGPSGTSARNSQDGPISQLRGRDNGLV